MGGSLTAMTTMQDDDSHRLDDAEPSDQPPDAPRDENGDAVLDGGSAPATEHNHNVNESHDKIRLETDVTRGTGTRDQEKHKLKVRGETPSVAADKLSKVLAELEDRNVFERARQVANDE